MERFDHRTAARYDGAHQAEPVPHTVRYSVADNRVDILLDGGGTSSLWWATKNEWLGLADVAGLEVEALYGGFAGETFTDDSREYVFVTRRPGSFSLSRLQGRTPGRRQPIRAHCPTASSPRRGRIPQREQREVPAAAVARAVQDEPAAGS